MNGAAAALIKDHAGRFIIVKPVYRPEWLMPGGTIEDAESPLDCCKRECMEELSIEIEVGELLSMEYRTKTADYRFIFDGGTINPNARIQLPPDELKDYRFVNLEEALNLVDTSTAGRLARIFSDSGVYFES